MLDNIVSTDRRNYISKVVKFLGIPFIITKFYGDYSDLYNELEIRATIKLWLKIIKN